MARITCEGSRDPEVQAEPDEAQFRLSMLASDAMRQRLTEKFEAMRGPNPQAAQNQMAMMLTFIGPIHTLKNLALGIRTTEEAEVTLAGELNSETDAQQCAHLMQTFIIPMVQKAVETAGKADAMRVDDSLSIRSEAAALLVRFAIGMGDINAMRGMGQAAGRPKSAAPTAVAPAAETAPADEPAAE